MLIVMKAGNLPHGKGCFPGRQQPHARLRIVVKMAVAAVHGVGLHRQRRVALHPGIGVRHDPVSILFQQKAGMSQPGNLHSMGLL